MADFLTLNDVCEFIVDTKHKTPKFVEHGYPCIRTPNIGKGFLILSNAKHVSEESYVEWTERAVPTEDDLIFAREAPVGNVTIIPKGLKVCHGQRTVLIRADKSKINPHYLMYLMLGDELQGLIHSMASGATVAHLNMSDIRSLKLPKLPGIKEQNKVAMYLANYDGLIENNNRRIAILEEMAQSLYREWFVYFRYPGHANQPDGSSDHEDNKQNLIDSPLGPIPEGWEVKRLDDFVTLQRGFDLPKNKRNEDGGIPIYAASGFTGYHDQVKAKGPGIVTGRSGTLGIVKLVLEDHWPLNTSLWVKKFGNCTAHYAYYLLDGIGLERFNSGASVPTLNRNDVHGNPVVAPPNDLIETFENIVSVNHKQINVLKRKNENLKKQRDMLLPKLISGQIELKD